MFENIINKISSEFIEESKSSPRLLEDLAAMEKYMAESYGGRTLIELIQNADDADSKKIKAVMLNNTFIFANDGRPFDENDLISISRSGASTKERGITIGYRGVGFKSTAHLTSEIIIFSNNTYFTFSKKKCAEELQMPINSVPTIRIPFLVDEDDIGTEIKKEVASLIKDGFKTVFIFVDIKLANILEEIKNTDKGHFLFLRNIEEVLFEYLNITKTFLISRETGKDHLIVSIRDDSDERWLILPSKAGINADLAFKMDQDYKIMHCKDSEAVFHCYLPTLDKVGYAFKINGDFSTDPSRKHLSMDDTTEISIRTSANVLFNLIKDIVNFGNMYMYGSKIIDIILTKSGYSKFTIIFDEEFKRSMNKGRWLRLASGDVIKVDEYKILPDWLEETEKGILRDISSYVKLRSLESKVYTQIPQIDTFLNNYTTQKYELEDFIEIIKERKFVEKINSITYGKILSRIIKSLRISTMFSGCSQDLDTCNILTEKGILNLNEFKGSNTKIDKELKEYINDNLSASEIEWFCNEYKLGIENFKTTENNQEIISISSGAVVGNTTKKYIHKDNTSVSKWRTAEQQCVDVEKGFNNDARDVSKQNLGYDIESIEPNGKKRFIEVKSLKNTGDSFTMTNNEYTAAHQYGDDYYLCLVVQTDSQLKLIYIKNPLEKLKMEKRVRLWEWFCDKYDGEQITIDYK